MEGSNRVEKKNDYLQIIFAKILLVFHNIILTKAKASIRVVFRCI